MKQTSKSVEYKMDSGYYVSVDDGDMNVLDSDSNRILTVKFEDVPDICADMMTVYLKEDREEASKRSCGHGCPDCPACECYQSEEVAEFCPKHK